VQKPQIFEFLSIDRILYLKELLQLVEVDLTEPWNPGLSTINSKDVLRWLGCLVRLRNTKDGKTCLQLSHFTVQEFLKADPKNVSSAVARSYLVRETDKKYLDDVCFAFVSHPAFGHLYLEHDLEFPHYIVPFRKQFPAYMRALLGCIHALSNSIHEGSQLFTHPATDSFRLFSYVMTYRANSDQDELLDEWTDDEKFEVAPAFSTPLSLACSGGFESTVRRLLEEGALRGHEASPLIPFTLTARECNWFVMNEMVVECDYFPGLDYFTGLYEPLNDKEHMEVQDDNLVDVDESSPKEYQPPDSASQRIVQMLLDNGSDIEATLNLIVQITEFEGTEDLGHGREADFQDVHACGLCTAIIVKEAAIASILINSGFRAHFLDVHSNTERQSVSPVVWRCRDIPPYTG
jgi:hypothetical protein